MPKSIIENIKNLEAIAKKMLKECHEVRQQLQVPGGFHHPAPQKGPDKPLTRKERSEKVKQARMKYYNNLIKIKI